MTEMPNTYENSDIEKPYIMRSTIVIPDGMRRHIISTVESLIPDLDDGAKFSFCEFEAALAIIGWILGPKYMSKEIDPIDRSDPQHIRLREDIRKRGSKHIADYREGWCRVIALSKYLEVCIFAKNFESKKKEFTGERFDAVMCELKLASHIMEAGCQLEFVPAGKKPSQPEIEFIVDGKVRVECKSKGTPELTENSLRNSLMEFITSSSTKFGTGHGSLFVLIPTKNEMDETEIRLIVKIFEGVMQDLALDDPQLPNKFDSIVVWNEYMEIDQMKAIEGLKTKPIFLRKGSDYESLPFFLKYAIEHPEYIPKRKYWIDYKGLGL